MKRLLRTLSIPIAVFVIVASRQGRAEEQFQLQTQIDFEQQSEGDTDFSTLDFGLSVSSKPVGTWNKPVPEARFLARVPWVGFLVGRAEFDDGVTTIDGVDWGVSGRYADPAKPVTFGLAYRSSQLEEADTTRSFSTLAVELGCFVQPAMELGFVYERPAETIDVIVPGPPPDIHQEFAADQYGLFFKNVRTMSGETATNLEARIYYIEYEDGDENTELRLGGDYYFTRLVGLGAEIRFNTGDEIGREGLTIGVRAALNANTTFGADIFYRHFAPDDDAVEDIDTFGVSLIVRF